MSQLDIDHKDILSFIRAKDIDGKFSRMNFSVRIPNSFYEQLENSPDSIHQVKFNGSYVDLVDNGNPVTVGQLWDEIVYRSHRSAEPGIINIDNARSHSTTQNYSKTINFNPCQPAFATVLTPNGISTIGEVKIGDIVWSGKQWTKIVNKWNTGIKEVFIYTTVAGIFIGTDKHRVVEKGIKIEVGKADYIDSCPTPDGSIKQSPYRINSVTNLGEYEVFDIEVEAEEHTYWTGGLLVSNCQEFFGPDYSSCCLGSINLTKFIKNKQFDLDLFAHVVSSSTRFLNNIIDKNDYPIDKIEKVTKDIRSIGLGIMGFAHALYLLGIPYNSEEAYRFASALSTSLTGLSMLESVTIASETQPYPAYDFYSFYSANKMLLDGNPELALSLKNYGCANSSQTSIAPTGTISYIANVSSGIEPVFALCYIRRIEKENKEYEEVYITDPYFEKYLDENFDHKTKEVILNKVADNKGSCQGIDEIPKDIQKIFVVASDISPMDHLKMLGSMSKNINLSISKTINCPEETTKEEIGEIYRKAHELGIIGVSIFRQGSRDAILIHKGADKPKDEVSENVSTPIQTIKSRDRVLDGKTFKIKDQHGNVYVTLNYTEINGIKRPWEIFIFSSNENQEMYAALGKTLSAIMRRNDDISFIIEDLKSIKASSESGGYFDSSYGFIKSRPQHLGLIIEEFINLLSEELGSVACSEDKPKYRPTNESCPDCGADLVRSGGCIECKSCGYAKCGS